MSIQVHLPIYNQIIDYCIQQLPKEACGVLWGTQTITTIQINHFTPLSNRALQSETMFLADEHEWVSLLFTSPKPDLLIQGLVHSHPTKPAVPSVADLQTQWHTIPTHWIISCENNNNPTLRAFRYFKDGMYEQLDYSIIS